MDSTPSKALIALRTTTFFALIAFMFFGPMAKQIGGSKSRYLRNWVMFSGFGKELCAVDYTQHSPDGTATPIDRTAALGYETYLHAPKSVRRLTSLQEVERQGRTLCNKLRAADSATAVEVRATTMCASRKGWLEPVESENLCVARKSKP